MSAARSCIALLLALCLAPLAAGQQVLLVDIDDVGWDLIESTPTPQLERMMGEGRVFRNFYAAPVCSPTRVRREYGARGSHPALLVGQTIFDAGNFQTPTQGSLVPLGQFLSGAGLTTAKVGKWHLAPLSAPTHPLDCGWGSHAGVLTNSPGNSGFWNFPKTVNGATQFVQGVYLTTDETEDAITALQAGVDVVSVSYHAVHAPFHLPPPFLYTGPLPTDDATRIRAALQALDHELGRLVSVAMQQDRLILIGGDNGSNAIVGGGKGKLSEKGVRVPFLALGPGVLQGSEHRYYGWQDVYATLGDYFGIPRDPGSEGPDSMSFLSALAGLAGPGRPWLYSERWTPNGSEPRLGQQNGLWSRAIRGRRFKLIRDEGQLGEKLYDLVLDPAEASDLLAGPTVSGPAAAALTRLRALLAGI